MKSHSRDLISSVVDLLVTQENPLVFGSQPPMREIEKIKPADFFHVL